MKKNLLTSFIVATFAISLFTSCSKKDSGNGGGSSNTPITALTISADKDTAYANGYDEVTFTVKDQAGNDVSASVYFYVNGTLNPSGNKRTFAPGEAGNIEVYAKRDSIISNKIHIRVLNQGNIKYTTKIIAEDFTGTWCGWCPRMTHKFSKFMENDKRIYTIGVHYGDAFEVSSYFNALDNIYNIQGFPTVYLNRNREFNDNGNINNLSDSTDMHYFLTKRADLGLAINSTINGNTLNITTKVGFDANISDALKLVVLIVEDSLVKAQTNYYYHNNSYPNNPYYNSGDPISNFVHNGVLRSAPSGIFGVDIPAAQQVKDNIYTSTLTADLSGYVSSNVKVVAFVTYKTNSGSKKGVINAQWADAGSNKDFD
ncbi:MAG: Omp28-related outer membrane protein [Chitinophagales bacterium]|nr:Omp28-related outer membrane protein [Chitinophagales bacterium]